MNGNILLVDDHPLFLEGLKYLLQTHDIKIAGVANNGFEALKKARTLKPDIILMDIIMPECGGLEALKLIKAEMPEIKIVMLTTSEEDEDLFEAIKWGASGYLLKSLNAEELVELISDLRNGGAVLSPGLASRLLKEFSRSSNKKSADSVNLSAGDSKTVKDPANLSKEDPEVIKDKNLTVRQLEVLKHVAEGKTYQKTGKALGLTERTVKYHMGRIIEQLHMENRSQVIAYAAKIGLVDGIDNE